MEDWFKVIETPPEQGVEIIGFSKEWIDEDFNPEGTRICYMQDLLIGGLDENPEHIWSSAAWCNTCDEWHTVNSDDEIVEGQLPRTPPTHWRPKPLPPK